MIGTLSGQRRPGPSLLCIRRTSSNDVASPNEGAQHEPAATAHVTTCYHDMYTCTTARRLRVRRFRLLLLPTGPPRRTTSRRSSTRARARSAESRRSARLRAAAGGSSGPGPRATDRAPTWGRRTTVTRPRRRTTVTRPSHDRQAREPRVGLPPGVVVYRTTVRHDRAVVRPFVRENDPRRTTVVRERPSYDRVFEIEERAPASLGSRRHDGVRACVVASSSGGVVETETKPKETEEPHNGASPHSKVVVGRERTTTTWRLSPEPRREREATP